jgi:hypothetical protein
MLDSFCPSSAEQESSHSRKWGLLSPLDHGACARDAGETEKIHRQLSAAPIPPTVLVQSSLSVFCEVAALAESGHRPG